MLAIRGLATSCQPISAVMAAGLDVVSDANPTATVHTTPVARSAKPSPLSTREASGVRRFDAKANVPSSTSPYPTMITDQHTARAAGTRDANRPRRERPVTTRSRKTPAATSPVPASTPIRIAASGPKNRHSRRTPSVKPAVPPAGSYFAGLEEC